MVQKQKPLEEHKKDKQIEAYSNTLVANTPAPTQKKLKCQNK